MLPRLREGPMPSDKSLRGQWPVWLGLAGPAVDSDTAVDQAEGRFSQTWLASRRCCAAGILNVVFNLELAIAGADAWSTTRGIPKGLVGKYEDA